ncbi:MAG: hypothetical protein DHS20C16_09410 [Phycisphaerae bacterium]|nr:MAG: hypothetical protein DHS20C16_09410 [Phycisphaerae bacterium]
MPINFNLVMNDLVPDRIAQSRKTGHFPCIKYHLLKLIIGQRQFRDIDALIQFCARPANLETWLPSPIDRRVISADLTGSLKKVCSHPS